MNIFKISYDWLCQSRKLTNRKKGEGIYYESHHIIPKCFGGPNTKDNLVLFTFDEHFLAHRLLAEMYEGAKKSKMVYALVMMGRGCKGRVISLYQYEIIRKTQSDFQRGKKLPKSRCDAMKKAWETRRLTPMSDSWKNAISKAMKGKNNPMFGKHLSVDAKKKVSDANKGRKHGEQARKNMSNSHIGKSSWNKGKHLDNKHKSAISDGLKNGNKRDYKAQGEKIRNSRTGTIMMNNGNKNKMVKLEEVEKYILGGWNKGNKNNV